MKLDNKSDIPYCKAAFSACQELGRETKGRGFILAHIMNTWDQRFKLYPARWSGDAKISWSQPDYPDFSVYAMGGFKENIAMVANPNISLYEVPFLANDAGGYDYFGSSEQSDELYIRWVEFASMNSIMTLFSTARNKTRNHPYRYSDEVQTIIRKYTHLRMMFFPYFYSEAFKNHLLDKKWISGDGIHTHQYFIGESVLVAPVYEKNQILKEIFIPEGTWYDFETLQKYTGPENTPIETPLNKLPIFIKEGSIIPLRNYSANIESGTNDTLTFLIYPSQTGSIYDLYEDDGVSNDYLTGNYAKTTVNITRQNKTEIVNILPITGSFEGMNNERVYQFEFQLSTKPNTVTINKKDVKSGLDSNSYGWTFDSINQKIIIQFKSKKTSGSQIEIHF